VRHRAIHPLLQGEGRGEDGSLAGSEIHPLLIPPLEGEETSTAARALTPARLLLPSPLSRF
jgi:hypothetical protein